MDFTILLSCLFLVVWVRAVISEQPPEGNDSIENPSLVVIDMDGASDDCETMLLVLNNQDKAKLLAVTCLYGATDVDNACNNALRVLALTDKQGIPVHKGSSGPLNNGKYVNEFANILGIDGLGNRSNEFSTGGQQLSGTPAALALSRLARTHPGSITVLAIGPLTNLALAHRIDPDFTNYLKEIVIVGGNYNGIVTDYAQFSFKIDPLSANIILTEAACPVTIVPYETVANYGIPWDKYQELTKINTTLGRFFSRVSESLSASEHDAGGTMYLVYDSLAAAVVIRPEIVISEVKRTLAVEYQGGLTQGLTVVIPDRRGRTPARIVTDLNLNGTDIFELYREMLVVS